MNLLATKFHRPSLPTRWVQRPKLTQKLDEGLESNRQIILVSAPAGFGKTSCIVEWVNTLDHWQVAWLSLDSSDDDPVRFFAYFIAALQQVDASLGQEIARVMRSGQLPPVEMICAALINDILAFDSQFLVVLDDFHVIQEYSILQVLEKLVANLPPQLRLILLTREDPPLPLAQLRANNRLTEIRARDLRFSRQDAARFLNDVMGLSLTQADIAELEDKTEGWIVGLQLAGLSIRDYSNPSSFIATLSGSHRFILSYLAEQVLDRQPEEIQRFLLQTSILDRLNGDLCDAITGRKDGRVLLERLFDDNLFLIPLDDEQQWYRYHHLFADLLRNFQNTLQKDQTAELHQRASHWYAKAGMVSEAIQHALIAEDYAMTVDLLESHSMEMILQGYVKTVNGWVQAIPAKLHSKNTRINLAFSWMHLLRGAYAEAFPYLERLQETLGDTQEGIQLREGQSSLWGEWLVMQSFVLYMQGKVTECEAMATQALEITPRRDNHVRSLAYYVQASVCRQTEDYARAVSLFQKSIQIGRAAENLVAEMMSTTSLAGMALEHGQLYLAFEIASQAVDRIERSGVLPPISAVVFASLGDAYYQWYHIEEARHHLLCALHLSTLGGSNTVTIFCRVLLSRLYQIEDDLEAAAREIQEAIDLVPVEAPEYVWQEVLVQQVRIHLARNQPAAAELALQGQGFSFNTRFSFPDLPSNHMVPASSRERIPYSLGMLYNSSLRVLLYRARAGNDPSCLRSGIELANCLIPRTSKSKQLLVTLEAILLRAQMYAALGDSHASQADYFTALEMAEPEGFISVFVEHGKPVAAALAEMVEKNQSGTVQTGYIECILDAFSGSCPLGDERLAPVLSARIKPMTLIDSLTDRELVVLRIMAEGLKYKEIAARLFISQNTVRFHVKAIYGKLNVNNRMQAIEKARQLLIL